MAIVAAGALIDGAIAGAALAEIKDYQIARMLNFRTECNLMSLKRIPPLKGEVERFSGECGNRTFYPDGIEISCPEADDEWACKVVTEKRAFENLDMLRQGR